MDIDVDLDAELLNKLNTMGTRDHEDLVAQFQSIVGSQISPAGCAFYLEMANWFVVITPYFIYHRLHPVRSVNTQYNHFFGL